MPPLRATCHGAAPAAPPPSAPSSASPLRWPNPPPFCQPIPPQQPCAAPPPPPPVVVDAAAAARARLHDGAFPSPCPRARAENLRGALCVSARPRTRGRSAAGSRLVLPPPLPLPLRLSSHHFPPPLPRCRRRCRSPSPSSSYWPLRSPWLQPRARAVAPDRQAGGRSMAPPPASWSALPVPNARSYTRQRRITTRMGVGFGESGAMARCHTCAQHAAHNAA